MTGKKIFVTVGTTKFDSLISQVTADAVLEALSAKGFEEMILQIGETQIEPDCKPRCGFKSIAYFKLTSSLRDLMSDVDLIISHAGAGTCLEVLELEKPLIVAINDCLMNNHQIELAQQLAKDGFLYYCTCSELLKTIVSMDLFGLKKFDKDRSEQIAKVIDRIVGFL